MYLFRFTRTPQWEHVTYQLNKNQANKRRWRGGARRAGGNPSIMGPTEDLRISVPNNLHRVRQIYTSSIYQHYSVTAQTSVQVLQTSQETLSMLIAQFRLQTFYTFQWFQFSCRKTSFQAKLIFSCVICNMIIHCE